ncbi:MAG: hypothetical protein M3444_00085 [Acidobacteriota bacterium]|nr:hypothetical protein [Acidobacteriota bacterium]MDQ5835511.1 hypothetical protein [Acidobacteriota bacterium]
MAESANLSAPPSELSRPHARPANGKELTPPQGPKGRGRLTIVNPGPYDIAVKLVESQSMQPRRFFYVHAGNRATVQNISTGLYYILLSEGTDWDSDTQRFLRDQSFTKFAESFDFRLHPYQIVELQPDPSGELHSLSIGEDEFKNK